MESNRDYDVGYGKPPQHTRFQKGRSGNPRGRPRGSKNLATMIKKALDEKIVVTSDGQSRKMTRSEVVARQVVNKGVKGDSRMLRFLIEMFGKDEPYSTQEPELVVVKMTLPDNGRGLPPDPELAKLLEEAQNKYRDMKVREMTQSIH